MKNSQRLRRFVVPAAALFLGACVAYSLWGRAGSPFIQSFKAPVLDCTKPTYLFGSFETGASLDHVFILRNTGEAPLTIHSARPDCGCSVVHLPDKIISPGQSMPVRVQLSLKNLRGPVEKRVVISSDDPARPNFFLVLKGTARSSLQIYPLAVNFGSLKADAEATQLVEFKATTAGGSFQVKKVLADSKNLTITQEALPNKKGYRVFVQTKRPLPTGPLRAVLRVQTDLPKEAEILIPVRAMVEGTLATPTTSPTAP